MLPPVLLPDTPTILVGRGTAFAKRRALLVAHGAAEPVAATIGNTVRRYAVAGRVADIRPDEA